MFIVYCLETSNKTILRRCMRPAQHQMWNVECLINLELSVGTNRSKPELFPSAGASGIRQRMDLFSRAVGKEQFLLSDCTRSVIFIKFCYKLLVLYSFYCCAYFNFFVVFVLSLRVFFFTYICCMSYIKFYFILFYFKRESRLTKIMLITADKKICKLSWSLFNYLLICKNT